MGGGYSNLTDKDTNKTYQSSILVTNISLIVPISELTVNTKTNGNWAVYKIFRAGFVSILFNCEF